MRGLFQGHQFQISQAAAHSVEGGREGAVPHWIIKWHPLSIFFAKLVAFVVDILPLDEICVTAVSHTEPSANVVIPHPYRPSVSSATLRCF